MFKFQFIFILTNLYINAILSRPDPGQLCNNENLCQEKNVVLCPCLNETICSESDKELCLNAGCTFLLDGTESTSIKCLDLLHSSVEELSELKRDTKIELLPSNHETKEEPLVEPETDKILPSNHELKEMAFIESEAEKIIPINHEIKEMPLIESEAEKIIPINHEIKEMPLIETETEKISENVDGKIKINSEIDTIVSKMKSDLILTTATNVDLKLVETGENKPGHDLSETLTQETKVENLETSAIESQQEKSDLVNQEMKLVELEVGDVEIIENGKYSEETNNEEKNNDKIKLSIEKNSTEDKNTTDLITIDFVTSLPPLDVAIQVEKELNNSIIIIEKEITENEIEKNSLLNNENKTDKLEADIVFKNSDKIIISEAGDEKKLKNETIYNSVEDTSKNTVEEQTQIIYTDNELLNSVKKIENANSTLQSNEEIKEITTMRANILVWLNESNIANEYNKPDLKVTNENDLSVEKIIVTSNENANKTQNEIEYIREEENKIINSLIKSEINEELREKNESVSESNKLETFFKNETYSNINLFMPLKDKVSEVAGNIGPNSNATIEVNLEKSKENIPTNNITIFIENEISEVMTIENENSQNITIETKEERKQNQVGLEELFDRTNNSIETIIAKESTTRTHDLIEGIKQFNVLLTNNYEENVFSKVTNLDREFFNEVNKSDELNKGTKYYILNLTNSQLNKSNFQGALQSNVTVEIIIEVNNESNNQISVSTKVDTNKNMSEEIHIENEYSNTNETVVTEKNILSEFTTAVIEKISQFLDLTSLTNKANSSQSIDLTFINDTDIFAKTYNHENEISKFQETNKTIGIDGLLNNIVESKLETILTINNETKNFTKINIDLIQYNKSDESVVESISSAVEIAVNKLVEAEKIKESLTSNNFSEYRKLIEINENNNETFLIQDDKFEKIVKKIDELEESTTYSLMEHFKSSTQFDTKITANLDEENKKLTTGLPNLEVIVNKNIDTTVNIEETLKTAISQLSNTINDLNNLNITVKNNDAISNIQFRKPPFNETEELKLEITMATVVVQNLNDEHQKNISDVTIGATETNSNDDNKNNISDIKLDSTGINLGLDESSSNLVEEILLNPNKTDAEKDLIIQLETDLKNIVTK